MFILDCILKAPLALMTDYTLFVYMCMCKCVHSFYQSLALFVFMFHIVYLSVFGHICVLSLSM